MKAHGKELLLTAFWLGIVGILALTYIPYTIIKGPPQ